MYLDRARTRLWNGSRGVRGTGGFSLKKMIKLGFLSLRKAWGRVMKSVNVLGSGNGGGCSLFPNGRTQNSRGDVLGVKCFSHGRNPWLQVLVGFRGVCTKSSIANKCLQDDHPVSTDLGNIPSSLCSL